MEIEYNKMLHTKTMRTDDVIRKKKKKEKKEYNMEKEACVAWETANLVD